MSNTESILIVCVLNKLISYHWWMQWWYTAAATVRASAHIKYLIHCVKSVEFPCQFIYPFGCSHQSEKMSEINSSLNMSTEAIFYIVKRINIFIWTFFFILNFQLKIRCFSVNVRLWYEQLSVCVRETAVIKTKDCPLKIRLFQFRCCVCKLFFIHYLWKWDGDCAWYCLFLVAPPKMFNIIHPCWIHIIG